MLGVVYTYLSSSSMLLSYPCEFGVHQPFNNVPNRLVRLLFYLVDFVSGSLSDSDGCHTLVYVSHTYLYLRIDIYTYLSFPGVGVIY